MSLFSFPSDGLDQLSLLLVVCTSAILVVALFLVVYTIHLRLVNRRTALRWKRMEERWEPKLQKILAGETPPSVAWRAVPRRHRKFIVDFLLQ